jgi:transposase
MRVNKKQYKKIENLFPIQRGNVEYSNHEVMNAMLYVLENGGKWRALPKKYGKWNSIYKRVNRWAKKGILEKIFRHLYDEKITTLEIKILCLDSTIIKVHPDGMGALKKAENNP